MPTIFEANDLTVRKQGDITRTTLADPVMLGADTLQVERVALEAGKTSAPFEAVQAERFVYVIRGAGQAQVGDDTFPLAPESMLWIEPDETFKIQAGEGQLDVLVCHAPARTTDEPG
jgi:quercetin dioxygenase-like cupin family protein